MNNKLLSIIAGTLIAGNVMAKGIMEHFYEIHGKPKTYECSGTKNIVGSKRISGVIWKYYQNWSGEKDGINLKKEMTGLYIWDGCQRLLREYPFGSETWGEEFVNDMEAIRDYRLWKKGGGK